MDGARTGAIDCDSTGDVGGPTSCTAGIADAELRSLLPENKRGMGTLAVR